MYNLQGEIILMGDLNALHRTWGGSYTNQCGKALIQFLDEHDITLISNGIPTSTHFNTPNPLDIAICSQTISLVSTWEVLSDCGFSDHYPTKCEINIKQNNKIEYSPYQTRNFYKADWDHYINLLLAKSLHIENNLNFENLKDIIESAASIAIP